MSACTGRFVRSVTALVAALLLLAAGPAQAAEPAKAKALIGQAREAAKAGKLQEAIDKLKQAQTFLDHPAILFAQARVYTRMLRLDLATAALDKAEADFELPRKLKASIAKQRKAIAKLEQKYGRLRVVVTPSSALITLDGAEHPGGFDGWVEPGRKRLEVNARGYAPAVRPATVEAGHLTEVKIVLRELTGTVEVVVPGGLTGVKVLLDGRESPIDAATRAGDIVGIKATVGAHEIVCTRGRKRDSKVLKVLVDRSVQVRCEALALGLFAGGRRKALGWGGIAVGALLAGLGGYHVNGYFDDADRAPPGHVATKDRAYGGTAFVVSGLAIGVTSWLLVLREPSDTPSSSGSSAAAPEGGPRSLGTLAAF